VLQNQEKNGTVDGPAEERAEKANREGVPSLVGGEKSMATRASRKSRTRAKKMVYFFGGGKADGKAEMKNLLGGKGANLAEMSSLGMPVPPGFTITTEVCTYFDENRRSYPPSLQGEVDRAMAGVEKIMESGFGDAENPLLLSVHARNDGDRSQHRSHKFHHPRHDSQNR
jgi:hypothetical protein